MARKGEKLFPVDLSNIGLNLSASPRGLKGAQAVISQNMDYSDDSGAIVGRRGSTTIAGGAALPGKPHDLYRAYNGITGKYLLCTFSEGGFVKIGAWKVGEAAFHTLQDATGLVDFTLTDNTTVSFVTHYNPALNQTVVSGTNGIDQPFYWDFTEWRDVTPFQFGTIDIRLKKFIPNPFGFQGRGRIWPYLRNSELVTLHGSDPDDHRLFVDQGSPIFFEVPQEDFSNPLRGIVPFRNQFTAFNLNSIATVYYTDNPDRLYNYNVHTYENGAINDRCITYWNGKVLFLDKNAPYLFLWDGARVHPLDRERMLTKGIQQWMDFSQGALTDMRMAVHEDNLMVSFTASGDAPGADANKWLLVANLTRQSARGTPYFPSTMWKLQANDIIVADGSTDFGQVYFADNAQNYVRRLHDFWDVDPYGDYNDQTGSDPVDITYRLMTGWIGINNFFQATEFWLNADYDGTPAVTDTLRIRYRFNGWTEWQDLLVGQVRRIDWIPFPKNAFGREIQYDLQWTTKTARPFLYEMVFKYVPHPFTRRLRA